MIIRARCVLTMDGASIENGAVIVRGSRIESVGPFCGQSGGEMVDLGDSILLPGLINAHCHLDYTNMRGSIARQASFTDWIRSINAHKTAWTDGDYLASIRNGIEEAARFGTTTIANLEAHPCLISRVDATAMGIRWFAEMIDVREPVSPPRDLDLAPHAPYTASGNLYAQTAALLREQGRLATTHLAESREEMLMFRDGSGPLFDFMEALGRPMNDCGTRTPLALMLERCILDERWIVAHLNELTRDDFTLLEGAPKFHIVHCPRSHAYFAHSRFRFEKLRALGFNICLGTDSLASNDDLSLFAEMREFARANAGFRPSELVEMVTTCAASALHLSDAIGRIARGFFADMIAIPFADKGADPFENVVHFEGEVAWRMLHGEVVSSR